MLGRSSSAMLDEERWKMWHGFLIFMVITSSIVSASAAGHRVDPLQKNGYHTEGVIDHLKPTEHLFPHGYYLAQVNCARWLLAVQLTDGEDGAEIVLFDDEDKPDYEGQPFGRIYREKANAVVQPISLELAERIYLTWVNVLYQTRYTDIMDGGLDGVTWQFSTFILGVGWLNGETWSPYQEAPPLWMTQLAEKLRELALSRNQEMQQALTRDVQGLCDRILDYLNESGVELFQPVRAGNAG